MVLTPLDLENVQFSKSFRGYNDEEVDSFLEQVAGDYEKLFKDNQELKEELGRGKRELEHYQNLEQTLKNTLILAEQTAEEVRKNAEREAELLFREAKARSEEIIGEAEKQAEEIYRRYREFQELTRNSKIKMQSFLQAQLRLIHELPNEENEVESSNTRIIAG